MSRVAWLFERQRPHYAMLVLAGCLLASFRLLGLLAPSFGEPSGQHITPASFLPFAVRSSLVLQRGCALVFVVCALLWVLQVLVPWSAIAGAIAFTAAVALWQEKSFFVDHMFHLVNVALIILALWQLTCRHEIGAALRERRFWVSPLAPRWIEALLCAHVGWFYTLAGIAKLQDSGWGWANGTSMQLWMTLWGQPGMVRDAVLGSRSFAALLQWGALGAELSALPLALLPRARVISALALLGFHLGQQLVFGWWFVGNMAVIALALLPVAEVVDRASSLLEPGGASGAWPGWLEARLDIRGRLAPRPAPPPDRAAS